MVFGGIYERSEELIETGIEKLTKGYNESPNGQITGKFYIPGLLNL